MITVSTSKEKNNEAMMIIIMTIKKTEKGFLVN